MPSLDRQHRPEIRIKPELMLIQHPAADESGSSEKSEVAGRPSVDQLRRKRPPLAEISARGIHYQAVAKEDVHFGMAFEKVERPASVRPGDTARRN